MTRSVARVAFAAVLMAVAVPAAAEERGANGPLAPSKAVADAWAREAREIRKTEALQPRPRALKILYGSYGVLQGLDVYSTILARNNGAREVNPVMSGSYTRATALKAAMTATNLLVVKSLEKRNRKAAIATMVVIHAVTAAVVTNNFNNARRLQ